MTILVIGAIFKGCGLSFCLAQQLETGTDKYVKPLFRNDALLTAVSFAVSLQSAYSPCVSTAWRRE